MTNILILIALWCGDPLHNTSTQRCREQLLSCYDKTKNVRKCAELSVWRKAQE